MKIEYNISLKPYNTFGIDVKAKSMVVIRNHEDLMELLSSGRLQKDKFLILGGGSNLVFMGDYEGLVVKMENQEWTVDASGKLTAGAGMVMDELVRKSSEAGWHGLENLAAIPGTVGASAVQNVGAYGLEAKDCIVEVKGYEIATGKMRIFGVEECEYGYRQSIFKGDLKDKYIIESVSYGLSREFSPKLSYGALKNALGTKGIEKPTAKELIDVITEVRHSKLPTPGETGSAGSFFKNPIVTESHYEHLKEQYPEIVAYEVENGMKLSAGWMIEHCGWKGHRLGHAGVYAKQALVLINVDGEATGEDVMRLATAVTADVEDKFGVRLVPEAILV